MGTYLGDRCGDCGKFPGNGQRCKEDKVQRNRVYALDYECENTDRARRGDAIR